MSFSTFQSKKITCKKHKGESIIYICVFPKCNFNSIFICSKCINTDQQQHYNTHKEMIYKTNDFFNNLNYGMDQALIDELTNKSSELEKKMKDMEISHKKYDDDIDNDFQELLKIFIDTCDQVKLQLKDMLREGTRRVTDKYFSLSSKIKELKQTKIDLKDINSTLSSTTVDKTEDFLKTLIQKRHEKFIEFNTNISSLNSETEQLVGNKVMYKHSDSLHKYFEDLKGLFIQNIQTLMINMKQLIETSNKSPIKSVSIDLSPYPSLKTGHMQSLGGVASVVQEPLKVNRDPHSMTFIGKFKIKHMDSTASSNQPKSSKIITKLASFPAIKNQLVAESLESFGQINYPNNINETDEMSPSFGPMNKHSLIRSCDIFEFEDGTIYQGQFKDGKRNGLGRQLYPDSGIYEGEWKDNVPWGFGRLTRKNGDIYEGSIEDSKANGHGIFCTLKGIRFKGEWINDKKDGYGEEYIKGTIFSYKGLYKNDNYHGAGKLQLQNGCIFEGNFINGTFTGCGTFTNNKTGETYEGEWKDWLKHGQGLYTIGDGNQYEGNFEDDLPDGYGIFRFSDGSIYKGYWHQGKQHGIGIQIEPNQEPKEGEWNEGQWVRWT